MLKIIPKISFMVACKKFVNPARIDVGDQWSLSEVQSCISDNGKKSPTTRYSYRLDFTCQQWHICWTYDRCLTHRPHEQQTFERIFLVCSSFICLDGRNSSNCNIYENFGEPSVSFNNWEQAHHRIMYLEIITEATLYYRQTSLVPIVGNER